MLAKLLRLPPLSLYIHFPWCIKKCPYCDFNSHALKDEIPADLYIKSLLEDFAKEYEYLQGRKIQSIFLGGGTPSLFKPHQLRILLEYFFKNNLLMEDVEITMEANPGALEYHLFKDYQAIGINRISLGVQSMQDSKLKILGRIHSVKEISIAIENIKKSGFTNFNLDIMYGLPGQSIKDALYDLQAALKFQPPHFSWYQLTIEPNTLFFSKPPVLPEDEQIWRMSQEGKQLLEQYNLFPYEVSAYAKNSNYCYHNLNYWQFGDYLGIGAGAHGKITILSKEQIIRTCRSRHPKQFLKNSLITKNIVSNIDLPFEFMLNNLRLNKGFSFQEFSAYTGLPSTIIKNNLRIGIKKDLLCVKDQHVTLTGLGKRFLNDAVMLFLGK